MVVCVPGTFLPSREERGVKRLNFYLVREQVPGADYLLSYHLGLILGLVKLSFGYEKAGMVDERSHVVNVRPLGRVLTTHFY